MKINILKCDQRIRIYLFPNRNGKIFQRLMIDWFFRLKLNKGTYTILRMLTCKLR